MFWLGNYEKTYEKEIIDLISKNKIENINIYSHSLGGAFNLIFHKNLIKKLNEQHFLNSFTYNRINLNFNHKADLLKIEYLQIFPFSDYGSNLDITNFFFSNIKSLQNKKNYKIVIENKSLTDIIKNHSIDKLKFFKSASSDFWKLVSEEELKRQAKESLKKMKLIL